MKMKLLATALVASAMLPTAAYAQRVPPASIVIVETDRIYRECNACRGAQTQLQTLGTQLQQRAQALGQPIETELQSLQQAAQSARNATGAARTTAETQITQRAQALEARRTAAQRELAQLEQNLRSTQAHIVQQINQRLNPIINQLMTQRGANVALDVNATLAHAATLNVTDAAMALLNQQLPAVSVTPLPQAAAPAAPGQPAPQPARPTDR